MNQQGYLVLSFGGIWKSDFDPFVKYQPGEGSIGIYGMGEQEQGLESWHPQGCHQVRLVCFQK